MTDQADPSSVPDVEQLVEELKRRVHERRRTGQYPTELTEELRVHFERIRRHRPVSDLEYLRTQLDALDALGWFSPEKIVLQSNTPGVQVLHAAVARLVSRQTQGVLEQVQLFGDGVRQTLRTVLAALEEPHGHVHDDLLGQVDALHEHVAVLERSGGDQGVLASLRARMEALEADRTRDHLPPLFDRKRFHEWLGEAGAERLCSLAKEFEACGPVLDIGDGSFLEVLEGLGIEAHGIDVDSAVAHLRRAAGGTLGGIALVGGVQHVTPQEVGELTSLACDKVRPGGCVVVHTTPLHPAYLRFLFVEAGFADVRVDMQPSLREDYALIATR